MKISTDDYTIEKIEETHIKISGVLRLQSPTAYDGPFEFITQGIDKSPELFTVDLKELEFLNSSGVTTLARIVLQARQKDVPLHLLCNEDTPWQNKTVSSLKKLYPKLTLEF